VVFLAGTLAGPLSATTNNFGPNLGSLNYTVSSAYGAWCTTNTGRRIRYYDTSFYNFVYVANDGSSQPISGSTYYISGGVAGDPFCPPKPRGPQITYNGSGYTIVISVTVSATINAAITVPGYVNPKYVTLGVTYAPPGPQSFVDYTNSTLISNTSSFINTFSTGYTLSVKLSLSAGLFGWANGTTTSTSTTGWGQESTNSSSVTVSKTTSISVKVPGPANPYVGDDHDYDVIWVWLNPVNLFTLSNGGSVQWNGYGYSTLDQPAMDVIGVYAGCLNGDLNQTSCNNLYLTPFARAWAAGEIWPSGQGPGLTATDLQNILAADPYGRCNSASPIGSSACPSPDPTRFTLTLNQSTQYQQPPPGGQPFTISYTEGYTNTSSVGQGANYTFSQAFGLETTYSGKIFGIGFNDTISSTQTLTWKNQWNSQFTSSTGSTAQASITGPPCTVVGSACSPAYPPSSPTYGQAVGFDVYQDNLFGTFLLVPVTY
jgi:hypothetical protein